MRHFLRSSPITLLTFGVGVTAAQAGLIAAPGSTDRASAGFAGTSGGAVALAAIAVAADQHSGAAGGAQIASSRQLHWSPWPMGKDGDARFVTYFAGSGASSQLWARHRVWLGGWSRCRARVSTGGSPIYRISGADAIPTQAVLNKFSPVERCPRLWERPIPCLSALPRFACQTRDCDAIPPPEDLRAQIAEPV